MRIVDFLSLGALLGLAAFVGCNRSEATPTTAAKPPVEVTVVLPFEKTITPFEEFPGHLDAQKKIMLRAQISGRLDKILFKDGADVEENQPLYEIDARTFQAEADRTAGIVAQTQARVDRLTRQLQRAQSLFNSRTISQEEFDTVSFDKAEADANLVTAKAAKTSADVNLSYTKIASPIAGRIGRTLVDRGNLIHADDTLLALILSHELHAYFDIDERTELKLQRLMRDGKLPANREGKVEIEVSLSDETDYSSKRKGTLDFVDNQIETNTGTQRLRAIVLSTDRTLKPGLFVRIRMAVGEAKPSLLIPEEALGSDQGQRFLYVVDENDKVVYRPVTVGTAEGSLRGVEGLAENERVIIAGLQKVKPGDKVRIKMTAEMPTDTAQK